MNESRVQRFITSLSYFLDRKQNIVEEIEEIERESANNFVINCFF